MIKKDKLFYLLLIIIISLGIGARIVLSAVQFAHYDDISLAVDINKTRNSSFIEELNYRISNPKKDSFSSRPKVILRQILSGNSGTIARAIITYSAPFIINLFTTNNGALPMFIMPFFVYPSAPYALAVFLIRTPSLLAGITSVLLMFLIIRKIFSQNKPIQLISIALFSLSWQNIIHSAQSPTYSFGSLGMCLLLYLITHRPKEVQTMPNKLVVLLGIIAYLQYQLLFIIPAFIGAGLLSWKKTLKEKVSWISLRRFIPLVICWIPLLIIFFYQEIVGGSSSYNAGQNFEYLFSHHTASFLSIVTFFIKNTYIVFSSNLLCVGENNFLFNIITSLLLFFFFWGCLPTIKKAINTHDPLSLFIVISILFWGFLIVTDRLAFTPTRVSIIYTPLLILVIASGLEQCGTHFKNKALIFSYYLLVTLLIGFIYSLTTEIPPRRTLMHEKEIATLIKKYSVDTVIAYEWTLDLNLMPSVINNQQINYFDRENIRSHYAPWKYNTVLYVSTRGPLFEYMDQQIASYIQKEEAIVQKLPPQNQYRTIFKESVTGNQEIEFRNLNRNGANQLFIEIRQRYPAG